MSKTSQWAVDAFKELQKLTIKRCVGLDEGVEILSRHASTDPIREKVGELVWAVQHAGLSSPAYWKIREIARELKKELEG